MAKRNPAISVVPDVKNVIWYGTSAANPPEPDAPDETDNSPEGRQKFAGWCFKNVQFALCFYNKPLTYLGFGDMNGSTVANLTQAPYELYPVMNMLKMCQFYLGKQDNMDYAYMSPDVKFDTLQPGWINGQEVSLFVDYFNGIMRARLANAKWTAKPVSDNINEDYEATYDLVKLYWEHKEQFDEIAKLGVSFSPANGQEGNIQKEKDVDKYMDETYTEEGAGICTDLATGVWFSNDWLQEMMNAWDYLVICSQTAVEHYVDNGMVKQRVIMPYYQITDTRLDNDYGIYDKFRGYIMPFQPIDMYQYPELTEEQRLDIIDMAKRQNSSQLYNIGGLNINWWTWNNNSVNSTLKATVYWKARRWVKRKKVKTSTSTTIIPANYGEGYYIEDMYKATVIGNKYMVDWGLMDNIVESYGNKRVLEFPIQRYKPNTKFGQSISKVGRIFKLQSKMDMFNYKILDEVGKSKGKVVIIYGDKLSKPVEDIVKDLTIMGMTVHVTDRTDEMNKNNQKFIDVLDLTLSDNVQNYMKLREQCYQEMQRVLSLSPTALGAQASYSGAQTGENIQASNENGTKYMVDGFMQFLVNNMTYAINMIKNLNTLKQQDIIKMNVGTKGVKYIKWMNSNLLDWADIFVKLNINDSMDQKDKQQLDSMLLSVLQNSQNLPSAREGLLSILKVINSKSYTEAMEHLKEEVEEDKENAKEMAAEQQKQQMLAQQSQLKSTEQIAEMQNQMTTNKALSVEKLKILGNILTAFIQAKVDKNSQQADFLYSTFQQQMQNNHEQSMQQPQPVEQGQPQPVEQGQPQQ
jgi:hypothetical protein